MDSINQIITKNEPAVAVFTTHDEFSLNLNFNDDGTGYTGDWILKKEPNVKVVIIYHRNGDQNNIYKANITSIEDPPTEYEESNRYRINFHNCNSLGQTNKNWSEFAHCGANPVHYFNT